jgi:uncharacterized protein (DUF169 family)
MPRYVVLSSEVLADSIPDLVICICSAEESQRLLAKHTAQTGRRLKPSVSGIGAACGECTAYVLVEGLPSVSLACAGSRRHMQMQEGEVLVAAPWGSAMAEVLSGGH